MFGERLNVVKETIEYTTRSTYLPEDPMTKKTEQEDDGNPKFGRLLIILFMAVLFCAALTWVMGAFFPDFPNF